MTADCRRPRRAVLALCALITGALSFSTATAAKNACEELHAWAVANYSGTTPTLDELTQLDRANRVAAFGVLSPGVRSALWQEHLRRFASRTDLSTAQHALVREAMPLLTPALYAQEPAAVVALREFQRRVQSAFPKPELRRAWLDLGSGLPGSPFVPAVTRAPYCDCNLGPWNDCWGGEMCGSTTCNVSAPGCGFAQASVCNGLCG